MKWWIKQQVLQYHHSRFHEQLCYCCDNHIRDHNIPDAANSPGTHLMLAFTEGSLYMLCYSWKFINGKIWAQYPEILMQLWTNQFKQQNSTMMQLPSKQPIHSYSLKFTCITVNPSQSDLSSSRNFLSHSRDSYSCSSKSLSVLYTIWSCPMTVFWAMSRALKSWNPKRTFWEIMLSKHLQQSYRSKHHLTISYSKLPPVPQSRWRYSQKVHKNIAEQSIW